MDAVEKHKYSCREEQNYTVHMLYILVVYSKATHISTHDHVHIYGISDVSTAVPD